MSSSTRGLRSTNTRPGPAGAGADSSSCATGPGAAPPKGSRPLEGRLGYRRARSSRWVGGSPWAESRRDTCGLRWKAFRQSVAGSRQICPNLRPRASGPADALLPGEQKPGPPRIILRQQHDGLGAGDALVLEVLDLVAVGDGEVPTQPFASRRRSRSNRSMRTSQQPTASPPVRPSHDTRQSAGPVELPGVSVELRLPAATRYGRLAADRAN